MRLSPWPLSLHLPLGAGEAAQVSMQGDGAAAGASLVAPLVSFIDAHGAGAQAFPGGSRGLPTAR